MKKFAIGCLGVLVVLAVVGGGIAWFKVIKPGMDFASGLVEIGKQYDRLNDQIENRSRFEPPADGSVSEQTLERFLATQRQISQTMRGRFTELEEKYDALKQEIDQRDTGEANLSELMGAYSDITNLLIDGKRAQVEALNDHAFSLAEYAWVRAQVYRALGESVAVAAFGDIDDIQQPHTSVPEETRQRVEAHREELMEAHALAWWGL